MACLNQKFAISLHEWDSHGDIRSVWENEIRVLAEFLDYTKHIIPPTAVKAGAMVTEFVDNLVHFEGGKNGLNQNSSPDCASRDGYGILRKIEYVIPETGLKM
jgi:hypothetical protein